MSPDLKIGITLAIFSSMGKTPFSIDKFNKCVSGVIKVSYVALTMSVDIESHPELERFNC